MNHIHSLYLNSSTVKLHVGSKKDLCHLKKRYRLGVISNTISNLPRYTIEKLDLDDCFSVLILSRDLGIRKPDPEIFWLTLKNLGVENYEAIHVGDSLGYDIEGAKKAGISTMWIRNDKKKSNEKPDYIIDSLSELIEIL